tara:strand:- start:1698 stop:1850 length:153 start_codon:yes stop_codon:yes gene_type:complete
MKKAFWLKMPSLDLVRNVADAKHGVMKQEHAFKNSQIFIYLNLINNNYAQ